MKKTYILKTILLAAVAMTSAACITDAPWRGGEPKPADGKVTFRISVPKNPTPATRALSAEQEYGIGSDDIGVLMFKAASPNEFVGHFEGVVVDGPDPIALTDGGASMMFEATLPMGGSYNLMVVANAGSILTLHSDLLVAGKTQAEVESGLLASMGAAGWNTGANPDLIPMWGYAKGVSIDDFTEVTGSQSYMFREDDPLDLVRMLARVDVKLNATLAAATAADDPETKRFVLQSVRIYNYGTSGRLIPDTNTATNGGFDWTKVDEPDDLYPTKSYFEVHQTASLPADYTRAPSTQPIVKTVSGSALERDIYLFETTAGVRPTPASTDYWNNPCLVIGGSYMGGETTYYRIDFAKPVSEESDTWEYLQLKRNNRYTVIIQDVDSSGAIDPAEALKSIPANVDADIIEWRGESDIKILLTDNLYMLGLSHDSFTFARSAQTTASEGNHLTVVTDYHSGWSATVSGSATEITSVTGGWLTLNLNGTGGTSVSESTPNRSTTGGTPIDIILAAQPAGAAGSRTAWVHVRAGNMSYAVKVTQLPKDPGLKIVDAVTGEEITQLPFPTTGATEKSFRVEWSPANVALDVIAVRDVREFRWTDADNTCGNTTLTDPDGNYTYRITPDNIADPNDPMEMFNRYGTRLIFVLPGSSPVIKKEIHLTQGTSFDALALSLDPIPSPAPVTWQGTTPSQQREFTVRSHITGTPSGGGEPVTVGVPWKVEYWIDGAWSATAPAWLGNIPAAWEYPAGEDTKTVGYNISQATPAEAGPGMKGKDEIGSQARPYNLSNPPSGSPDAVVNTANCYVIDTPGWYSLPLVYGNAIKGSAPNPDSYSWNHPTRRPRSVRHCCGTTWRMPTLSPTSPSPAPTLCSGFQKRPSCRAMLWWPSRMATP